MNVGTKWKNKKLGHPTGWFSLVAFRRGDANKFYHSIASCTTSNQTQVQQHDEGEGGNDDKPMFLYFNGEDYKVRFLQNMQIIATKYASYYNSAWVE